MDHELMSLYDRYVQAHYKLWHDFDNSVFQAQNCGKAN